MQHCKRGRIASRVVTIHDEDGVPCVTNSTQHQHWRCHFIKVLNVVSQYDDGELALLRQRDVITSLSDPPSADDVVAAMQQLKNGKAGSGSRILPEMLKVWRASSDFVALFVDFMGAVRRGGLVPHDWRDAILIPIPKKDDLYCCDNWRGISLLDVVGKLLGKVVQNCLQKVAEKVLPESQCGFRKGCSCTNIIFMVRQLRS